MGAPCVAVAYSGGRDSTALLHATLKQAAPLGLRVLALHVHHGLSAHADAWLAHGQAQCQRWARRGALVELIAHRIVGKPARGESVEAWARDARYKALAEMAKAQGATVVLLAHHRRDQAETLLLQALRGAGLAGLAGMPRSAQRDGVQWLRPWLDVPRETIDAYVRRHRLSCVEDDSNETERFARNRLRRRVWPALLGAFPQAEGSLASAARWAQEAVAVLSELAEIDLGKVSSSAGLDVDAWLGLSVARRGNALRAWLQVQHGRPAQAALVTRLLDELPRCRNARWAADGAQWQLYKGMLTHHAALEPAATRTAIRPEAEATLSVRRAGASALPGWGGTLKVERVAEGGVPLPWLAQLELRPRVGGERFQAGLGRPPRSLKLQYQAAGVPERERHGPLIYSGGQLVFVPALGLDARVIGLPGQPLVRLVWVPAGGAA